MSRPLASARPGAASVPARRSVWPGARACGRRENLGGHRNLAATAARYEDGRGAARCYAPRARRRRASAARRTPTLRFVGFANIRGHLLRSGNSVHCILALRSCVFQLVMMALPVKGTQSYSPAQRGVPCSGTSPHRLRRYSEGECA
jgi:hypothetical protein